MTFYWWSHWFWITFLNGILFFTIVQTYPSQEFKVVEYNQNISNKTVTKLFQQTSPTLWASPTTTTIPTPTTASPTSTQIMDLTTKMIKTNENLQQNVASKVEYEEVEAFEIESGKNIVEEPKEDATYMDENNEDYEFKRSAEIDKNRTHKLAELKLEKEFKKLTTNDTQTQQNAKSAIVKKIQTNKKPTITLAEDDTAAAVTGVASAVTADKIINNDKNADNNYSINFSNISTNNPTNLNNITSSSTFEPPSLLASTSNSSSGIPPPPSAPAAPQIFDSDTAADAAEWLHTAIAPPPPPSPPLPPAVRAQQQLNHNIDDISSNLVTIASTSNVQKIPFTLENANKEDELRRAESEHRSRKSKVLSADYKQINRYINYAADPKSLLTRSASTAPNDFNGDNESNISSEALAIQRTYFLDAGAISAICFTVFGVCCTVGTIGIVLYRRRYWNKPQTLSEPDSSVYIDDSTMRVSDNSDEMYSLDNDSFLNSLEAMTIQNYWTDTVKHTKL